jgi:hypothetical protein
MAELKRNALKISPRSRKYLYAAISNMMAIYDGQMLVGIRWRLEDFNKWGEMIEIPMLVFCEKDRERIILSLFAMVYAGIFARGPV